MHTLVRFVAPLLVAAGAVAGLVPAAASASPAASVPAVASAPAAASAPGTAAVSATESTGVSFVGPVIPLDMLASTEIFAGGLYRDEGSLAAAAAVRLHDAGRTEDASLIRRISDQPTSVWLGDWLTPAQLRTHLARHVAAATKQGTTPVFVTYAIPNRDCGGHSAGGLSQASYLDWNRTIASALSGTGAVVLVEPDALAMLTGDGCAGEKERRLTTMAQAVDILAGSGLTLYLDAGHSGWASPTEMAALLESAGVYEARGFVSNVSNFRGIEAERAFDEKLSKELGGKSYVIDVSRNGTGWQGDWCNPAGAGLGSRPLVADGRTKLDALLWVKRPGESDGACNGGPPAGQWWESYALDLARNQRAG